MENNFVQYIEENKLFSLKDKLLVAISGGIDSIVLLHLLYKTGYDVILAHCNFSLRGTESDMDEAFVKELANRLNLPLHLITFDTISYANKNKISIEMAARELRYNWFKELVLVNKLNYILTGHHINDSIETMLLNLCRGTGINGVTGIKNKKNNIVRPLLFATREQIENYANHEQLEFRHDASNDSTKYMRNIIRHEIIPIFKKINPSFEKVMIRNQNNFEETAKIYNEFIQTQSNKLLQKTDDTIKINKLALIEVKNRLTVIFELLNQFGFNESTCKDINNAIETNIGSQFYSNDYQLLIDRNELIIAKNEKVKTLKVTISSIDELISSTFFKRIEIIPYSSFTLIKDACVACIDLNKITFPMNIRNWEVGDKFKPIGMNNYKKVSDFFIDQKIDSFEKEKISILTANGEIVWIINLRLDNRFKVDEKTKQVLLLYAQ